MLPMLPLITVSAFGIRYQKALAGGTNLKNITLNFLFCHEYIIHLLRACLTSDGL